MRYRAVLDALWHDIELTRLQRNVTIFGFDCHASFQHQKEIIGIIMVVPNEFTLGFQNHDVIVIVAGYDFRAPLIFEAGQFFRQIDSLGMFAPLWMVHRWHVGYALFSNVDNLMTSYQR